ncbi:MAG TPA: NAD(P)-binding domain-containing protein [Pseudonocardia sp.]|jgi:3-hydroxyisobutyrate dehydrogenase-like beta-hydroxyacid dehydrogenase|nr:NAD(P)-binding domain-containing protein [Pseudonocardia sp.]
MTETTVSVLGLGAMGSALASAFLRAGHSATVWNRTRGRAAALPELAAARRADTAAAAVAASPLVVLCVVHYDAAYRALEPATDQLAGTTLVNLCNGTPRQAREMAAWAAGHSAEYLDGGIMAVPPMIGGPAALTLYSGSPAAFETHRDTLAALGNARHLGAEVGLAALYDLALLSAMYGMFGGFLHAVSLVRTEGIKAGELLPLVQPWLLAMVPELTKAAEQVDSGDYGRGVVSPLAMQAAAFGNFVDSAHEQGIRPDLLLGLRGLLDEAVAAGHGGHDISSLVEVITRRD